LTVPDVSKKLSARDAVEAVARSNFVISESLRMKVVNYHALALRILPKVEELTRKKSKVASLVVAIKRLADHMEAERLAGFEKLLQRASVTLTSGIVELSIAASSVPRSMVLRELLKILPKLPRIPDVVVLPEVVKLLAESEDSRLIKKEMGALFSVAVEERLAKIVVRLGKEAVWMPGVATFVTEMLYRNGVIMHVAYIGRPDLLLVVEEKFGMRAYDVLRTRAPPNL
jgi:hypothetical protein